MHHLILIIKVLREPASRNIFDFSFKDFRDGVSHLLEYIQEEHEFIFSLFAISHVLIKLINGRLKFLILLVYLSALIRLTLKLRAVSIKDQIKLGSFRSRSHLLLEHQSCSFVVAENLLLLLFNLRISVINLLGHLMHMPTRLVFICLHYLDLFLGLLQFFFRLFK